MGQITITSAALQNNLSYDGYYAESEVTLCGFNSSTNVVSFNSVGGYRVGLNYVGVSPLIIRILSYSDTMVEIDSANNETVMTGYTPSVLLDSLGNPVSFPYEETLTGTSGTTLEVNQSPANPQILCPNVSGNSVRRRRILTYEIEAGGQIGPVRVAQLDLFHNS